MADATCAKCGRALDEEEAEAGPVCLACTMPEITCARCGAVVNASESCFTTDAQPVCLSCTDAVELDLVMAESEVQERVGHLANRAFVLSGIGILVCMAITRFGGVDLRWVSMGIALTTLPQALLELVFPGRRGEERLVLGIMTGLFYVSWLTWGFVGH